jgi:hypothetical protein
MLAHLTEVKKGVLSARKETGPLTIMGLAAISKSRKVELFVMAPGRAVRELPLARPPLRVVCSDRTSELGPKEVSIFYVPILRKLGFATRRRVFSDGSTEQIVATKPGEQVVVHAERAEGGAGSFVRVAAVLNS